MTFPARRRNSLWAAALVAAVLALGVLRPEPPAVYAAGPTLPIRAAFYYPWFPQSWTQQSIYPFTWYTPTAGFYDSGSAAIVDEHIALMEYAHINVGISSWWGQGHVTNARVPLLLNEAHTRNFYWTLYYEPALDAIQLPSDLTYIYSNYGSDPNFLHVGGKPVLFIYTRSVKTCADVATWVTTNAGRFYLDPQVFGGYRLCVPQPDSWHQYAPTSAEDSQHGYSFTISPGFWLRTDAAPRLARDPVRWRTNISDMVASNAPWQLITTFNEWGEGTAVEDATQWDTCDGIGLYLEALHEIGSGPSRQLACQAPAAPASARSPAAQVTAAPAPVRATVPVGAAPAAPAPRSPSTPDLATIERMLSMQPLRVLVR